MSDQGVLTVVVWPPYVGLTQGHPGEGPLAEHEPFEDMNYSRGQVVWRTPLPGVVMGRAEIYVPTGVYTHVAFFSGPQRAALMGTKPLEQPMVFNRPGVVELDPIVNQDVLPRRINL